MIDFDPGAKPPWPESRQARAIALVLCVWSLVALLLIGVQGCGRRPTAPENVCWWRTDTVTLMPFTTIRTRQCS